jgi:hypothetical protein
MVVPLDEVAQEASSIREAAEALREGRGVLQGFKPGLEYGQMLLLCQAARSRFFWLDAGAFLLTAEGRRQR